MMFKDNFRVSLLNTNYNALNEQKLIATAGDFQWQCISKSIGIPLSEMVSADGKEVYAAFYYVELFIPENKSLKNYRLDHQVFFQNVIKGFKNISVKGTILFDHSLPENLDLKNFKDESTAFPKIIFGNSFISPQESNEHLKMSPSTKGDFNNFSPLPLEEIPHSKIKDAKFGHDLRLFSGDWISYNENMTFDTTYEINPDRDSNGAGLVYFSNFIAFMDYAERKILSRDHFSGIVSNKQLNSRTTKHRKIVYFGNARLEDTLKIEIKFFKNASKPYYIGMRYLISRLCDSKIICLSECIKDLE